MFGPCALYNNTAIRLHHSDYIVNSTIAMDQGYGARWLGLDTVDNTVISIVTWRMSQQDFHAISLFVAE